jgi:hypothetical protein
MAVVYELWHIESGNLLGTFDAEEPALALVRELVEGNGPGIADGLELGVEDDVGRFEHLGSGAELLRRARASLTSA